MLSRLTESGLIEATIEQNPPHKPQLKAAIQYSLPTFILFTLKIEKWSGLASPTDTIILSNAEDDSIPNSAEVSSTQMFYTSKGHNIYSLTLTLANPGSGT
ncbi:MAG: hypothetical protein QXD70_04880 [Candidatus Bathyarchaeia archaeon]